MWAFRILSYIPRALESSIAASTPSNMCEMWDLCPTRGRREGDESNIRVFATCDPARHSCTLQHERLPGSTPTRSPEVAQRGGVRKWRSRCGPRSLQAVFTAEIVRYITTQTYDDVKHPSDPHMNIIVWYITIVPYR